MTVEQSQIAGLKRRVDVLEAENDSLRNAVGFTVRTLDLHKDPTANPLEKIVDRERAEKMLRDVAAKYPTA